MAQRVSKAGGGFLERDAWRQAPAPAAHCAHRRRRGLKPAGDGVGRPGTQVRADSFDGGVLAGCDDSAAQAVRAILRAAEAPNIIRSYAGALRYWSGWFVGRYGRPLTLPVPPAAVAQFIVDHLARTGEIGLQWDLPSTLNDALARAGLKKKLGPLALASLIHRVAALSAARKQARQLNPCKDRAVRTLLSKARRAAHKRGGRPVKKTALLAADLRAMAATCGDSLKGKRDRALLYFAFASGGRGKAVAAIVKDRARLAGLEGDFAGHSLRSGFVTEGAQRGVALPALMAMTDHRSVASVVGYFQAGSAHANPAARLLDEE